MATGPHVVAWCPRAGGASPVVTEGNSVKPHRRGNVSVQSVNRGAPTVWSANRLAGKIAGPAPHGVESPAHGRVGLGTQPSRSKAERGLCNAGGGGRPGESTPPPPGKTGPKFFASERRNFEFLVSRPSGADGRWAHRARSFRVLCRDPSSSR